MLTYVPVTADERAVLALYDLLIERSQEEDASVNISHRALPTYAQHWDFVRSAPYYRWYLIYDNEEFVGSISITKRNEIGIVLKRKARGCGFGKSAVKRIIETEVPLPAVPGERSGKFLANINPNNARSIALFTGLGFKHIQNTYEL